jgi:hypothetical protein
MRFRSILKNRDLFVVSAFSRWEKDPTIVFQFI